MDQAHQLSIHTSAQEASSGLCPWRASAGSHEHPLASLVLPCSASRCQSWVSCRQSRLLLQPLDYIRKKKKIPRSKITSRLCRSTISKKSGQHCKRLTVLTFAWPTGNVGIICMCLHHIHLYCSDNKSLLRTFVRKWCDKITCSLVLLELHSGLKQQQWSVCAHLDWPCSWQLQEEINSFKIIFRFSG